MNGFSSPEATRRTFVPKIKGGPIRLNYVFGAVRIEPLVPCPVEKANAFIYHVEAIQAGMIGKRWSEQEEFLAQQHDPDMAAIGRFMFTWEGHADLTAHNVMCRENGELVLVDPLYIDPDGYDG